MAFGSFHSSFFVSLPPYCTLFACLCRIVLVCWCVGVAMRSFCCEHWAYVYLCECFSPITYSEWKTQKNTHQKAAKESQKNQ